MSKQEQVLIIEPQNELKFIGPFTLPVTAYMKLSNPTDKNVMFKIKTTAPKRYCVRPNSGLLEPHKAIEIAICLQPFLYNPAEKNKHKFMVQTVFAPESADTNLETLWKEISPDQLMDSKLKCVFDIPSEETDPATATQRPNATETNNEVVSATAQITAPIRDVSTELQRAAKEVQQLRESESELRQENIRLKEEIFVIKNRKDSLLRTGMPPPAEQSPVLFYALSALIIGVLGAILGKLLL